MRQGKLEREINFVKESSHIKNIESTEKRIEAIASIMNMSAVRAKIVNRFAFGHTSQK